eukprot:2264568-Alexandrium_andersonii.AAC.1
MLDRTKTSGPGRRIRWLPVHVARDAYYAHPGWLEAGFRIWQAGPYAFTRDYFAPVADEAFRQPCQRPATYQDMCAYSHAVYRAIRVPV